MYTVADLLGGATASPTTLALLPEPDDSFPPAADDSLVVLNCEGVGDDVEAGGVARGFPC